MSFDPSFQYTQGIGAGASDPSIDITGLPSGVDPSDDPTQNEYYAQRLQTPPWIQAGFPDYQSYAQNLRLKEELSRGLQEKQLGVAGGSNAVGMANVGLRAQELANTTQNQALQREYDQAKLAADTAHQQAIDALGQGNAAEAKRQFDISSQETQRYHTLDLNLRQQSQQLESAKFGQSVYDKLADLASNPRNFMEQFFRNRGQEPPPNSAAYGNTSVTGPGLMSAQQFIPSFLGSLGLGGSTSSPGAGAASSPSASAPPPPAGYGGQGNPGNPYAGTNMNFGGSPTQADTANIGGVKTWAGGPFSGKAVDQSPADAGDLTPYLKAGQAARTPMMAQGGEVTMTAPHALVNLLTGKVAAIAGEAGKEHARFDGAAIIDPEKGDAPVSDTPPVTALPDASTDPGVYYTGPTQDQYAATGTPDQFAQQPGLPPAPQPIAPAAPLQNPQAPIGLTAEQQAYIAQQTAQTAAQNAAAPVPPKPPVTPPPTFFGPSINTPAPATNTWGGPSFTNPSTLQSTPSGIGANPQFLPEDAAAQDPIVAQMIQNQAFPPFLQRIYAQAKGLPGLGTNVPQQTNLPAGLPLVSKLAYSQMSPSERSAFESFLSAHGITLEDYLTMVEAASPHGGVSNSTAIPKFLSQGG